MKTSQKEVELEFELPGFDKKDIHMHLSKNALQINASKKHESKVRKKDFFHEEKIERHFSYSTTLPKINPKKSKIEFRKGILKIKAPKE